MARMGARTNRVAVGVIQQRGHFLRDASAEQRNLDGLRQMIVSGKALSLFVDFDDEVFPIYRVGFVLVTGKSNLNPHCTGLYQIPRTE